MKEAYKLETCMHMVKRRTMKQSKSDFSSRIGSTNDLSLYIYASQIYSIASRRR